MQNGYLSTRILSDTLINAKFCHLTLIYLALINVASKFWIKLQPPTLLKKETAVEMFSCKFYGILKNMFSIEQLWGTVSRNRKMDTRFIKDKFHWNLIHLYLVIWRLVLLLTGSLEKSIENHDLSKYEEQVKMQIWYPARLCTICTI